MSLFPQSKGADIKASFFTTSSHHLARSNVQKGLAYCRIFTAKKRHLKMDGNAIYQNNALFFQSTLNCGCATLYGLLPSRQKGLIRDSNQEKKNGAGWGPNFLAEFPEFGMISLCLQSSSTSAINLGIFHQMCCQKMLLE